MTRVIKSQEFIFLDFQTTGTVAARSDVIEAGWGVTSAAIDPVAIAWTTRLIALDDERTLSRTIQRLTGLSETYYKDAPSIDALTLKHELRSFLATHGDKPIVIHYAQFKLPFLWKVIAADDELSRASLLARVICVHRLSRLLIPELKSFSLRAVAGFAGYATAEKKRSIDHLTATAYVWRHLAERLEKQKEEQEQEMERPDDDIVSWLKTLKPGEAKALPLHDPELRKKRLALPEEPGVYFFLDRFGNILYVGKAASLKHRVNSYFRGRKTKGSRLNEMLTRACDFRFVVVGSELEALIRENDEIKRHDPPYNRLLRVEGRHVQTLRFNDFLPDPTLWGARRYGPLSSLWTLEALRPFLDVQNILALIPAFMSGIDGDRVRSALHDFFASYGVECESLPRPDDWHKLAQIVWPLEYARLERLPIEDAVLTEDAEELSDETETEIEERTEWTAEDLEHYVRDAFRHLLRQINRSRWFLRLCHCHIEWEFHDEPGQTHQFFLVHGSLSEAPVPYESLSYEARLACFDMQVYDRIAIIYSVLKRGVHRGDKVKFHIGPKLVLDERILRDRLRS